MVFPPPGACPGATAAQPGDVYRLKLMVIARVIDGRAIPGGGAGTGEALLTVSEAARSSEGLPDDPTIETDFTTPFALIRN